MVMISHRLRIFKIILLAITLIGSWAAVFYFFVPLNYYEYPASDESDCLAGEWHDPWYEVCYMDFRCYSDEICDGIDQDYQAMLDDWRHVYSDGDGDFAFLNNFMTTFEDYDGSRAQFDADLWSHVGRIIPDDILDDVADFKVYRKPFSQEYAYVEPMNDAYDQWRFAMNARHPDGIDTEFYSTIIHEIFHILSLNDNQIVTIWDDGKEFCRREGGLLLNREGCVIEGTYLESFYEQFWEGRNFSDRQADYVSWYAMESVEEDAAESFTHFVLEDLIDSSEIESVRDEKIYFFRQFSDLVTMRNEIRQNIKEAHQ